MYLLDTHTLFWLDTDPSRLSATALAIIRKRSNSIFVSSISVWELSIKHRLGKLPSAAGLLHSYYNSLAHYDFRELSFSSHHALAEKNLSSPHKDPFDRALVAQAMTEKLSLISNDPTLQDFKEISIVW
jgi:PIN domain nuclease of toxin-antitoxin system